MDELVFIKKNKYQSMPTSTPGFINEIFTMADEDGHTEVDIDRAVREMKEQEGRQRADEEKHREAELDR